MAGCCSVCSGNGWRKRKTRSHRERSEATPSRLLRGLWPLATTALLACNAVLPDAPSEDSVLEGPVENLTGQQLAAFMAGDREFSRRFGPIDGLGPIFVATACESCHVGDGKDRKSTRLNSSHSQISYA